MTIKLTVGIVSSTAGRQLGERLFGPPESRSANIPTLLFSHPEVDVIGLTEPKARERFGDDNVKVYHTGRFIDIYHDIVPQEAKLNPREIKVIRAGPEEKVVGLHSIGMGVINMLQGFGVAIKMGATLKDFRSCLPIHPINSEELVSMQAGVHSVYRPRQGSLAGPT